MLKKSTLAIALATCFMLPMASQAEGTIVGLITKTNTNPFFVKMKEGAALRVKKMVITILKFKPLKTSLQLAQKGF